MRGHGKWFSTARLFGSCFTTCLTQKEATVRWSVQERIISREVGKIEKRAWNKDLEGGLSLRRRWRTRVLVKKERNYMRRRWTTTAATTLRRRKSEKSVRGNAKKKSKSGKHYSLPIIRSYVAHDLLIFHSTEIHKRNSNMMWWFLGVLRGGRKRATFNKAHSEVETELREAAGEASVREGSRTKNKSSRKMMRIARSPGSKTRGKQNDRWCENQIPEYSQVESYAKKILIVSFSFQLVALNLPTY